MQPGADERAAWVEVDAAALRHNMQVARALAGTAGVYVVCKGDAYGFDALAVARIAAECGMAALACGDPSEVRRIRAAGIALPILLYGVTDAAALPALARDGTVVTAHDRDSLAACLAHDLAFSLKIDAGFGRLGFREDDLPSLETLARAHPRARVCGIYTHLADTEDAQAVAVQAARFAQIADRIEACGWHGLERMVASSRVMLAHPQLMLDAVNPGRLLYGLLEPPWDARADVRPVLAAVKARIIALKDFPAGARVGYDREPLSRATRVAVVPYGFADGYPRLPGGGEGLLHGRRVRMLGPRHTEHTVLDVTEVAEARPGDEVVFLGTQAGEHIALQELAATTGVALLELASRLARGPNRRVLGA